jgi:hypothetical protein
MKKCWHAIALLTAGGLAAVLVAEWPGIKRYVKIERM